jgi:hypothetical protein
MSGWNHIALVYRDGTPSLYFNGKLIKTGKRTGRIVHPGLGSPDANIRFVHFEGDMTPPALIAEAFGEERLRQLQAAVPAMKIEGLGDGLNWFNGDFQTQQFQFADEPCPVRFHILMTIKIVSPQFLIAHVPSPPDLADAG